MLEKLFENSLCGSRFIVLLAVIFGLIGAIILFIVANIIGAVDLYLIAVVMLIFSFGIYELFISKIDAAEKAHEEASTILAIHSLDQLKDKIAKVIVMVLVVNFFQRVIHTEFKTPLEMMYFALSITALAVGLYFIGKVQKH